MKNIILVGGGGHCKAVIDVIQEEGKYTIFGIVDKKELIGSKVLGYTVIACDDDLEELYKKCPNAIVTVGHINSNQTRVKIFKLLEKIGFSLPTIVSPFSFVSKHACVGEGSVVMHHSLVNAGASVGKNCIINTKALCEHDSIIEDSSHISTGAIINGGAVVKKNSFVGSLAVVVQYTQVEGFLKAGGVYK